MTLGIFQKASLSSSSTFEWLFSQILILHFLNKIFSHSLSSTYVLFSLFFHYYLEFSKKSPYFAGEQRESVTHWFSWSFHIWLALRGTKTTQSYLYSLFRASFHIWLALRGTKTIIRLHSIVVLNYLWFPYMARPAGY